MQKCLFLDVIQLISSKKTLNFQDHKNHCNLNPPPQDGPFKKKERPMGVLKFDFFCPQDSQVMKGFWGGNFANFSNFKIVSLISETFFSTCWSSSCALLLCLPWKSQQVQPRITCSAFRKSWKLSWQVRLHTCHHRLQSWDHAMTSHVQPVKKHKLRMSEDS